MFKLKSTLAAGIALAIIGGIIACSSQMAQIGQRRQQGEFQSQRGPNRR